MKKVLVTGAGGYIGKSLCAYLQTYDREEYCMKGMSVRGDKWKEEDFSQYDCVVHTAGIAHIKETKENARLYYDINRDLTVEVAQKAKRAGVRQFIFLSSISIYGVDTGILTKETIPNPKAHYARSKLQAEKRLSKLADNNFKVCILRPPMVYGKGCKGNFQKLARLVKLSPIFPRVNNRRSMIYIDNLCEFIRQCVEWEKEGIFVPQNKEYVNTDKMVKLLGKQMGKKIYMSYCLGAMVRLASPFLKMLRKAFGSLVYNETPDADFSYCIVDFETSIQCSIGKLTN
ncbi:MAG: NAD-dependent epimerase/dehydratase family protein [Lachnoclostridium sp.]|nr:NAD-dependent epimerase/dehydratase family protein [Lachnospira sp.]MCM1246997.1 NAD-dependent epimerase/dehydratase family protein [Lachnoclostridium sp.]MCM1535050.1 NAD-dependent epimerase/dehydratase family protein [Clostridium sp.]